MIFKFRNVGIIESADIELKGLTVITGLNDTGKSFISKSIYSSIKTIKDSNAQESNEKSSQLDAAWISIRVNLNSLKRQDISILFEKFILPIRTEVISDISNKIPVENTIEKLKSKQLEFSTFENIPPNVKQNISAQFDSVINIVKTQKREEDIRLGYFNRVIIQQLFRSQFNSLGKADEKMVLTWEEGGAEILKIVTENNKTTEFKISGSLSNLALFQDATIIDSPIILQLQNLILKHRLELNRGQEVPMPLYYADLVSKFIPLGSVLEADTNEKIQKIIKGTVVFEEKTNKIVYQKENGQSIDGMNIANGIKSFGILQLLLSSGAINKNSILIIDEPEVHLHPQWEIEYAEIIVILSSIGIPIIISSHSPYLIEAVVKFSEKYKIKDNVRFYYGKKAENGFSTFRNVTDNLAEVFEALALPMKTLSSLSFNN